MLLALLAAAAQPAPPAPPRLEFVAGRAVRGRWRMEAMTVVAIKYLPPTIGSQRCTVTGPGLRLAYSTRGGGTDFQIGGAGHGFENADIIGLEIGGVDYEARMVTDHLGGGRYRDVDYPTGFVVASPNPAPPARPGFGVRRRPVDPWLSHVVLLDEMLAVPSIGIRYRRGGRERRARLWTAGFGDALRWCEETFESDRARRLPARLRRIILR